MGVKQRILWIKKIILHRRTIPWIRAKKKNHYVYTQEQVNDIVSKRLAEANSKAEKKLKDEVSKTLAEAKRQSKLKKAFDKTIEAGANYGKLFNLYLHRYPFLLS